MHSIDEKDYRRFIHPLPKRKIEEEVIKDDEQKKKKAKKTKKEIVPDKNQKSISSFFSPVKK